jgi:type IV secretion system protein VirB3
MHKNVLFRGCTRPAMFLGVPYIPFFIGAGGGLLMGMYFDLWFLLLIPVIIFFMQQMTKRDEMIFRMLGLRWRFRMRVRNLQRYSGMWVFSPNEYRRNVPGSKP